MRKQLRVRCCANGCRRHAGINDLLHEAPRVDGWATFTQQYTADHLYLCPVHRLELEENGTVSSGRKEYQ